MKKPNTHPDTKNATPRTSSVAPAGGHSRGAKERLASLDALNTWSEAPTQRAIADLLGHNFARPLLMVDVVLLTLLEDALHVGLVRRENESEPFYGAWCLPGGFIRPQEDGSALDTARRVLRDKAQVQSPYLEQLATFSGPDRDPRGWSASIAYYALVPAHIAPESDARFRWAPVASVPDDEPLAFDHETILAAAIERVRSKSIYSTLPLYLMPEAFSMAELRVMYERVLDMKLENRSFVRRIEELDVIEDTGETRTERGRPARLYRAKGLSGSVAWTRYEFQPAVL